MEGSPQLSVVEALARTTELPVVRRSRDTNITYRTVLTRNLPNYFKRRDAKIIINEADKVIKKYTQPPMHKEMVYTNANHCFLQTEADAIYFASVFVQPAIHSFLRALIYKKPYLRSTNLHNTFTHLAEVRRANDNKTRSDFIYFAQDRLEVEEEIKNEQGTPPSKVSTTRAFCIIEYKAAGSIRYKDFTALGDTHRPDASSHVQGLISQLGGYALKLKCKYAALTDMNGFITVYFGDMEGDKIGKTCTVFVTKDRNDIRRSWLGCLALAWDGKPPPGDDGSHDAPLGGEGSDPADSLASGMGGLTI